MWTFKSLFDYLSLNQLIILDWDLLKCLKPINLLCQGAACVCWDMPSTLKQEGYYSALTFIICLQSLNVIQLWEHWRTFSILSPVWTKPYDWIWSLRFSEYVRAFQIFQWISYSSSFFLSFCSLLVDLNCYHCLRHKWS